MKLLTNKKLNSEELPIYNRMRKTLKITELSCYTDHLFSALPEETY